MKRLIYFVLFGLVILSSCKKDWLDAKPTKSLVVPETINDYQLLLNNRSIFGTGYPSQTELANGDGYVTYATFLADPPNSRFAYIWDQDNYKDQYIPDWIFQYQKILGANVVLDGLEKLSPTSIEQIEWNSVRGQALFFRAFTFYCLTQTFCKPYEESTAMTDLGLPLKLSPEVDQIVKRSTLKETYDRIIADLNESYLLLPINQQYKTQPTKNAVMALLARIYLSMKKYSQALDMAEKSLAMNTKLIDYNSLDNSAAYPFPLFNDEVIWHAELANNFSLANRNGVITDELFNLYEIDDLRKTLFFQANGPDSRRFIGNYSGVKGPLFNGLANDELYLILAECKVRSNRIQEGMDDLNALMETRYKTSTYHDQTAANETTALRIILTERRKQLLFRNIRWSDLRRLNSDQRFAVTLSRTLNGVTYTLPPNDSRYTFFIPTQEILLSGIEQNPK